MCPNCFPALLLTFILSIPLQAQKHTISGYITDAKSGERLIGANAYEITSLTGTVSNNYGFYSLSLPRGTVQMTAAYLGYDPVVVGFELKNDTVLHFPLNISAQEIAEVTIIGGSQSKLESTQMSMIDIPIEKFIKLPVLLGEADVLKVIQLLPGVQSGTEGATGIYVRGGGPDQNLFLLDGVPVYNASHLFGFLSVFNPDAIKSVQLYKGGFPARYGERLSSVVDIRMKEGNEREYHGNFSIGLISTKLSLEGPIIKDKTAFIVSGRRTYADILARPFIAIANSQTSDNVNAGYYFYDLNAKINHKFSDKSRLYLSSYLGSDEVYSRYRSKSQPDPFSGQGYEYRDQFGMGWGNTITALRWNYLIGNKLFSNTTLTYSKYNFDVFSEYQVKNLNTKKTNTDYFKYFSGIEDYSARIDFDYFPASNHSMKFGAAYTYHNFKPGVTRFRFDFDDFSSGIDTTFGDEKIFAREYTAYLEDNFNITSRLRVNAGFRLALFNVQNISYPSFQPRTSIRYLATDNLSFKASYSRMVQFVHLLTTSALSLPTDLWLPVTRKFEPPVSNQVAIGSGIRLPWKIDLTVEAFYKDMKNLIEYKEGAFFGGTGSGWENKVEKGRGWAYGAEILLEKSIGKTSGWLGYTISRTGRQFENINFGRPFPAKYDRLHDIGLALTHKFSEKRDIGLVWVYGTGHAATLGIMKYPGADFLEMEYDYYYYYSEITEYSSRNNYRAPSYHRVDLSINLHKEKKRGIRTWNFSVYNAYNRKNPFFIFWDREYYWEYNPDNPGEIWQYSIPVLKKISLFPIIPSVSYSFSF